MQNLLEEDCKNILDSFQYTAIYVTAEADHRLLYINRMVQEITPHARVGMICHEVWAGYCNHCPIGYLKDDESYVRTLNYNCPVAEVADVSATRIMWQGKIPAYIIIVVPHVEDKLHTQMTTRVTNVGDEEYRDSVTGGYNRKGFLFTVENIRKNGSNLNDYAVLFVNIKGFKAMNDVLGHDAGDQLLHTVYTNFRTSTLRPTVSARSYSDHFVFLIEKRYLDLDALSNLLEYRWRYQSQELLVHCHCGICNIEDPNIEIYEAIDQAKISLEHLSGEAMKSYTIFDSSMQSKYIARAEVLSGYRNALRDGEFKVYYQPIVDTMTGKIVSAEALIRWENPKRGRISPGEFIPILEEHGYISTVDAYVLEQVNQLVRKRLKDKKPIVPLSVNLSRLDLFNIDLLEGLKSELNDDPVPPEYIRYEITETAFVSMLETKKNFLEELRNHGKKILLDDFGSGYSSFNMLNQFDFDVVKLDMEIIRQIEDNAKARSIISSLITLCHELNIQVVAEGVEKAEEVKFLQDKNCDYIQGYYFSKPLNEEDFIKYLEQ